MKKKWIVAAIAALILVLTVIILIIVNGNSQPGILGPTATEVPTTPYPTGMVDNFLEPDWDK